MSTRLAVLFTAMALAASAIVGNASSVGVDAGVLQTYSAERSPTIEDEMVGVSLEIRSYPTEGGRVNRGRIKHHQVVPDNDFRVRWSDIASHQQVSLLPCIEFKDGDPELDLDGRTDIHGASEPKHFNVESEVDRKFIACTRGAPGQADLDGFRLYTPDDDIVTPLATEDF